MSETLFQKIIERKLPATILYEDDQLICINDKFPLAKVHILVIVKKVVPSIHEMRGEDLQLLPHIFQVIQQLAIEHGIADNYRVITNRGVDAGQSIFHLHFHLLGGEKLGSKAG